MLLMWLLTVASLMRKELAILCLSCLYDLLKHFELADG